MSRLNHLEATPGAGKLNLAEKQPDVAAKLDERLGRWLKDTGARMPTPAK